MNHALTISKQIDDLGGTPTAEPRPVKLSEKPEDMLRFDLVNEQEHHIDLATALGVDVPVIFSREAR